MITECFSNYNTTLVEVVHDTNSIEDILSSEGADLEDDHFGHEDHMEELLREGQTPLYEGSSMNRLAATLLLLNLFLIFGISKSCAKELMLLVKELLPFGNTFTALGRCQCDSHILRLYQQEF